MKYLEDNELSKFIDVVSLASTHGFSLDQPYGQEHDFKTILQLAIDEDYGELYIKALLEVRLFIIHIRGNFEIPSFFSELFS